MKRDTERHKNRINGWRFSRKDIESFIHSNIPMAITAKSLLIGFSVSVLYLVQLQALPIPSNDAVLDSSATALATLNITTAIDTLSDPEDSTRVKRQGGGCGCGCGCCCCRPRWVACLSRNFSS
ncbi:hypothetical protein ANCDUO_02663 [Ancylostoma duodenale]|uniref:Uncharacterized protein n=1 Tax=Ancylostoma duodenale TaxID=51022 RepID=A0A0C2DVV5_9BILA|nr:hypothetical protein ANCDUO_02663 [Ancylostoma duodenale]